MLTQNKTTIAVAGTHGKTSTCSIISHILKTARVPFFGFLGGISANYKTNYFQPENDIADLVVVEADEFDRSFLQLHPDISVVTAVESDHLDIYGTFEELKSAYSQFASQTSAAGKLLLNEQVDFMRQFPARVLHYGIKADSDVRAYNIRIEDHAFVFDASLSSVEIKNIKMAVPGVHNIENALAAMEAVKDFVKDASVFVEALKTYRGVHRRFEMILNQKDIVFIDDYAHHPTEIRATLDTARKLYPDKKILGIFQPHLFSRTKDLAGDFAESLSALDEVILLPIYPARELPVPGVTSEIILEKIKNKHKSIVEKSDIALAIANTDADVVITIGAGDIDRLVEPLSRILKNRVKE
jgi:UDP-N-acetylmuramate--alanine ligase